MRDRLDSTNLYYEELGASLCAPVREIHSLFAQRLKSVKHGGDIHRLQLALRKLTDISERLLVDAEFYPTADLLTGGSVQAAARFWRDCFGVALESDTASVGVTCWREFDVPIDPGLASFASWPTSESTEE